MANYRTFYYQIPLKEGGHYLVWKKKRKPNQTETKLKTN